MKTKNTIKLGMLTLLAIIYSTAMWSNTFTENGKRNNPEADQSAVVSSNLQTSESSIADLTLNAFIGETANAGSGDVFYNSPDPFSKTTVIHFHLMQSTNVRLTVMKDNIVRKVLISGYRTRGQHSVEFDSKGMPPGTYIAILETGYSTQADYMTKQSKVARDYRKWKIE